MDNLDDKLIGKYFSGACTEAETEQILRFLNASEENRREWLKLRMVSAESNFARISDPEHVDRSYRELRKEKATRERLEKEIVRKITLRVVRFAASILLLVGVSYASYKVVSDRVYPEMLTVATGTNEPVREILLGDSTRVWLSAESKIEYPKRFSEKDRNVSVEGKLYFEVAKDSRRPFFVKTADYTVKVLGTAFEITSFKDARLSDVILAEGSVEVLKNDLSTLCLLQPGQQFELNRQTGRFRLNEVDAEVYTGWRGGKLEFDGMTFAEIAKVLERHYNVRIVLADGIAKEQRLVGSLSFEKDIHEMMKTIEQVVPIKYNVAVDTVVFIQSK